MRDATCPLSTCCHAASSHKTRPGNRTAYCLTCAIEAERGTRTQRNICDRSAASIRVLA